MRFYCIPVYVSETPQLSRNASDQDKDNRRTKPGPDWPQKAGKGGGQSSVIIWINHAAPGTYVRPHRHPHTFELLLPLRGRFVVLNFDDRGTVTHRAILGETCTVLEMAAGTWHAVLSLDTGGIIFEVKHGGYQPVAADDYAHWAPAEGEPGTTELMAWYAQAQVGDSTFAV
ncbi:WbuC family cupin fold metalloprotein [Enterobacter hormaechei]